MAQRTHAYEPGSSLHHALWNGFAQAMAAAKGTFACSGHADFPLDTSLHVRNVCDGKVTLPLSELACSELLKSAEPAPYGKGRSTLINTSVRQAWQIDPSALCDRENSQLLASAHATALRAVETLMGIEHSCDALPLETHLHKLLLYQPGGHFKSHRDTEKEPGMFGTMILQLPTCTGYKGGALSICHHGQVKTFDLSENSSMGFFYMAFFADCKHELQPITTGTRLCLVFNLILKSRAMIPPGYDAAGFMGASTMVEEALKTWFQHLEDGNEGAPDKYVIPLEHKYTKANLSFAKLKGQDRVVVELLRGNKSIDIHLCLLCEFSGILCDEYELRYWLTGDGTRVRNATAWRARIVDFKKEVLHSNDVRLFKGPYKQETTEYLGNEGGHRLYWYRTGAIVVWPKSMRIHNTGVGWNLEAVEAMHQRNAPETSACLQDIVKFCIKYPKKAWLVDVKKYTYNDNNFYSSDDSDDDLECDYCDSQRKRISRLLKLCLEVGCLDEDTLERLIQTLPFNSQESPAGCCKSLQTWLEMNDVDAKDAQRLVSHVHGWDPFMNDKVEQLTMKALELDSMGCRIAGVKVAKATYAHLNVCKRTIPQHKPVAKVNIAVMACTLMEVDPAAEVVEWLKLTAVDLLTVLDKLTSARGDNTVIPVASMVGQKLLVTMDHLHLDIDVALKLFKHFIWLKDVSLLEGLTEKIVQHSKEVKAKNELRLTLVEKLLVKEYLGLWEEASKKGASFKALVEWLDICVAKQERPQFSWHQPLATFPDHEELEAFLQGPSNTFFYTGHFERLYEAGLFAKRSEFDGKYHNGMSATAMAGGRDRGAFVEVHKTRDAFEERVRLWEQRQANIQRLRFLFKDSYRT